MTAAGVPELTARQQRHPNLALVRNLPYDARDALVWLRRGYLVSSVLLPAIVRRALLRLGGVKIEGMFIGLDRCYIQSPHVSFGAGCGIGKHLYIEGQGRVTVGANAMVGPETMIITSSHDVSPGGEISRTSTWHETTIGDGCWLGARVTVMPGVTIGAGAVVGSGAVVTKDCEPGGMYVGVPAKRVK